VILKEINIEHFGPFVSAVLEVSPDVTVLTGPNDAGKSCALRAIEIVCSRDMCEEHEVNRERAKEFSGKWQHDKQILSRANFEVTNASLKKLGSIRGVKTGSVLMVNRPMNKSQGMINRMRTGENTENVNSGFNAFPNLLILPLKSEIRQELDLENLNSSEKFLVELGFGVGFTAEKHIAKVPVDRAFSVREAERALNERLDQFFPKTMPFRFMLQEVNADPAKLGLGLVDEQSGFTPLGSRGTGVRRLLNVMGAVLRLDPQDGHSMVLYDEPETSLHADAQHMLRKFLEDLASKPNVQVVYSTHSSAMINNFRPTSIRVLERTRDQDKAQSVFVDEAFDKSFSTIRTSLGICPSDSLLYAPITIVAEGKSEVLGIPALFEKLAQVNIIPKVELDVLLSQSHILDGEGSSFGRMCDLAISQNAQPILFLDGDKEKERKGFQKTHTDVPVVELSKGHEFEDLVPKASYLTAISELLGDDGTGIDLDSYEKWINAKEPKKDMMFSKRVNWYVFDTKERSAPKKHLIVLRAIELANAEDVSSGPILDLFEKMKTIAANI